MNPTVRAIATALRAVYLLCTFVLLLTFLFPGLGWYEELGGTLGPERVVGLGIGWALLGVLMEHARGTVLRGRQAWLAQAILRLSPDLKRLEAVRILIQALASDDNQVVDTAHEELKRLTEQDHGRDPEAWRRWLRAQEKGRRVVTTRSSGVD